MRGSDRAESVYTSGLQETGIEVIIGHRPENISGADLVIASSAIPDDNPELVAARAAGIRVFRRKEFLGELTAGKQTVAVAGTHGKSTTSGMIAWILERAGQRPTFIVGAVLADMGTNAGAGDGPHFVIEADEYEETFLGLEPSVAVVTNVEHDHPDCFPRPEDFHNAFVAFTERVQDLLVVCLDDSGASRLEKAGLKRLTYGLAEGAQWRAEALSANDEGGMDFQLVREGQALGTARNLLLGEHNVRNSLAALAVVNFLGVPLEKAVDALFLDSPKNRYLANGHNYQSARLPLYLPGNGGLLTAVAMMAAGWDGCPDRQTPGFPDNGKWHVRWEGLRRAP